MAANGTPEQPDSNQPPASRLSRMPALNIPTKWLLIGGGAVGVVVLAAIAVVSLFLTGVIGGGNPQPDSVLDLVPDNVTSVWRYDLQRIFAIDLFADQGDIDDLADELGINSDDLSEMVIAKWSGGDVIVMKGKFDLDYMRGELEDVDAEENTYRGYEVWENPYGKTFALLDGYLITSNSKSVEYVLKNLYNGSGSLQLADSDNEMKQILDKLGSGYIVEGTTGPTSCRVERCEGYGAVTTEVDEVAEKITMEIALLFRNERAAERAAADYDEVADFLEEEDDIDIDDTEAQGRFVVGAATQDIREDDPPVPAAPAPTVTPYPTAPAQSSRADWIDHCYDSSPTISRRICGCVHDYFRDDGYRPVPRWELDWERGTGIGAEAVIQCYRRGAAPAPAATPWGW